ncbi:N5-glutamine methyltransferase family protein [Trueperella sp. LYQ141]|uniref:N5-glutamine methyltransferase family protein n=1 Tax=Trueperella sp. LYQ141 TaxID=3391058 RepID=UPI0039834A89
MWARQIAQASQVLADAGVDSPAHDARILAEHCWQLSRPAQRGAIFDIRTVPTEDELARYAELVRRRAAREPLQHICGVMWFRYVELEARPGVFIVRPETEIVVDAALAALSDLAAENITMTSDNLSRWGQREDMRSVQTQTADHPAYHHGQQPVSLSAAERATDSTKVVAQKTPQNVFQNPPPNQPQNADQHADAGVPAAAQRPLCVVDLCTGSGAIALSLATESPVPVHVHGVEYDQVAWESAQRNNQRYGALVQLHHADARTCLPELAGQVDLVVSNPPYVPPSHELSPEVRQDPQLALFGGGADGLDIPRQIMRHAHTLLRSGGILIMEHAHEQAGAMRDYAAHLAMTQIRTGKDLTGEYRYVYAQKGRQ